MEKVKLKCEEENIAYIRWIPQNFTNYEENVVEEFLKENVRY